MTLSSEFAILFDWFEYLDKPEKNGNCIKGLKENAPAEIKDLYKKYKEQIKRD